MSRYSSLTMNNNRSGSIGRFGDYKNQNYTNNYGVSKAKVQSELSRVGSSSIPKKTFPSKPNSETYSMKNEESKRSSNSSNLFSQSKINNKYQCQQEDLSKRSTPLYDNSYNELLRKQGYTGANSNYSISQQAIKPTIKSEVNNSIFSNIISTTSNNSNKKLSSEPYKFQSSGSSNQTNNLMDMCMSSKSNVKQVENYVGLANLGNTCYMNTSLQLLINCSRFVSELLKIRDFKKNGSVAAIFKELAAEYKKSAGLNYMTQLSPRNFKSIFEQSHPIFTGFNQHDSQEFLRILLDDISCETNRADKVKFREIDNDGKEKLQVLDDYDKFINSRESSIVTDYFYGYLLNSFVCLNCSHTSYTNERFMEIPIYLRKSSH